MINRSYVVMGRPYQFGEFSDSDDEAANLPYDVLKARCQELSARVDEAYVKARCLERRLQRLRRLLAPFCTESQAGQHDWILSRLGQEGIPTGMLRVECSRCGVIDVLPGISYLDDVFVLDMTARLNAIRGQRQQ